MRRCFFYLPRRARLGGFTLVELLVAIGIIIVLIGIVSVMAARGRDQAQRARVQSDLQGIAIALEAYRQDFGDYPRLSEGENFSMAVPADLGNANLKYGSELLCWALVGPYPSSTGFSVADGAEGPGFRVRGNRGLVYGPYLNLDTYKYDNRYYDKTLPAPNIRYRFHYLKDFHGNPILYFAAQSPRPGMTMFAGANTAGTISPPTPPVQFLYNFRDNNLAFFLDRGIVEPNLDKGLQRFRTVLGDVMDAATNNFGSDGAIGANETAVNQGPFILWSAGKDGMFGPDDPTNLRQVKNVDDVLVPSN